MATEIRNDFTIYLVKRNADLTEGRGPMVVMAAYLDENSAWAHADEYLGVMGRKPVSGSWRNEKYGDWQVEPLLVRSGGIEELKKRNVRRKEIKEQMAALERELKEVGGSDYGEL